MLRLTHSVNNCSLCTGVGYLKRSMPSGVSLVPCYWSYWFVISWNFTNLLAWSIFSGEPILPDYSHVWSIQKQIQQYDNWEGNQTWNCKVRNCYSNYWTACHIHSINYCRSTYIQDIPNKQLVQLYDEYSFHLHTDHYSKQLWYLFPYLEALGYLEY